ncbi:aprataxin and PNK-like factor isoform X2 [Rhinatrema bivittatum]|nr:aprataxin and PNK-like factor isoform X2 [Rhinatrema bivittatum]
MNPCFYQASDKSCLLPLERNEWRWLHPGDCFSLLPDKYVFQVISSCSDMDSTLRNSQMLDEEVSSNNKPDSPETKPSSPEGLSCSSNGISSKAPFQAKSTLKTEKDEQAFITLSQTPKCNEKIEQPKQAQRKRVLPEWMLQGDLEIPERPTSVTKESGGTTRGQGRGRNKMEPAKTGGKIQRRKRLSSAEGSESNSETEQDQEKKSRIKVEQIDTATQPKAVSGISVAIITDKREAIDKKGGSQGMAENEEQEPGCKEKTKIQQPTHTDRKKIEHEMRDRQTTNLENEPSQSSASSREVPQSDKSQSPDLEASGSTYDADNPPSSVQMHSKRIPCMYGSSCYRKNPAHFQQFCHPGDSDYLDAADGSQDDSDDRPECPYGTACYRKNPQHKLEYKHTKCPETEASRSRRKTAKKGKSILDDESDNDGEPNEYDLNDSFLDDEEEEEELDQTDEDSDWKPDSEDKDSEDMEMLLKEAHTFVKMKK